jgi:hypothetical protein
VAVRGKTAWETAMTDRELMQQALEALGHTIRTTYADARFDAVLVNNAITVLRERLAQPERGCAECGKSGGWALYCVACMEKVFCREWVGLTEEEIRNLWDGHVVPVFGKNGINPIVFARAIEAKLKEKNT